MWARMGWVVGAILLALSGATAQTAAPRVTVLEGGTLIDGTGKAPITDPVIVVEGDRIKAVGKRGQVAVPANATIIRTDGRTILPGLIDVHVHTQEWHYPMFLHYGVTSFADLDNDTAWIFSQRALLASGKITGPRMYVGGGKVYGPLATQAGEDVAATIQRNADDARAYIKSLDPLHPDYIKIDDTITYDQLAAVIAEAKARGLKVLGHTQNILIAARMGSTFMEHMDTMTRALIDPDGKKYITVGQRLWYPPRGGVVGYPQVVTEATVDPEKFPPLIAQLVKLDVHVNPTLVGQWISNTPRGKQLQNDAIEITKDPGLVFVPERLRTLWTQPPPAPRPGYANVARFLREYAAAGGKVVVGTDSAQGQTTIPGLSEHYEMQALVDTGIPAMKVLQGATLWNAEAIGKDKEVGSVEPGKYADFTIIEGDPLANIANTRNIRMVIKAGQVMNTAYDPKWANPIPHPYINPPWVRTFNPVMAPQDGPAVTLQIDGTGFQPGSIVRFYNADLPTHYVSPTKLTATVGGALLQNSGEYPVYVVNPPPRAFVSPARTFLVDLKN